MEASVAQPLIIPDAGTDALERLSETELAYHRQVMAQVNLLPQIDQQIAALQARRSAITGARDSWMQFQKDARGLDDGDTIDGAGRVFRQAPNGMAVTAEGG
jgi:hypothetical protein